jgi:antitoxin component of RelBE/YafQ-DinJ toxin-antitoxin module
VSSPTSGQNTVAQVEVDADLLRRASEALSGQGLTAPRAIELMLKHVVLKGGLPLDFIEPNAEPKEALEEVKRGEVVGADRVEERMADLNRDTEPSKTLTTEEFNRPADSGEDISAYLDWGKEWR